MIREPLMLIVAFFVFFFLAFVYVRLDFSISKDEGQEVRLKVSGYCEKIVVLQVRTSTHFTEVFFLKNLFISWCFSFLCRINGGITMKSLTML